MPETQEIFPGLYQLSGAVNMFLIVDEETGVTMIDAGLPRWRDDVIESINELEHDIRDVNQILVTHADVDHVGSLGPLAQSSGAEVYAGQETSQYVQARKSPPHLPIFMAPFAWIANRLFVSGTFVHNIIEDGETLPFAGGIKVIAAPGHTPDNFVYYWEREKVLFAADLLNTMQDDKLSLSRAMITWKMDVAKESARQILDNYDLRYICVGHGNFVDIEKQPEQLEYLKSEL